MVKRFDFLLQYANQLKDKLVETRFGGYICQDARTPRFVRMCVYESATICAYC